MRSWRHQCLARMGRKRAAPLAFAAEAAARRVPLKRQYPVSSLTRAEPRVHSRTSEDTRCSHRPDLAAYAFATRDRKSTRLNSSHSQISYAVFCLKKKKTTNV